MPTMVVPSEGWEIMEPQKPDNSPGPGPEVTESPKSEQRKESVPGQCRMRREVSWDNYPQKDSRFCQF